jgi:hypothetical protein
VLSAASRSLPLPGASEPRAAPPYVFGASLQASASGFQSDACSVAQDAAHESGKACSPGSLARRAPRLQGTAAPVLRLDLASPPGDRRGETVDVDFRDPHRAGRTALMLAAEAGHLPAVRARLGM